MTTDHAFEVRATCPTTNGVDLARWEKKTVEQRAKAGCAICGLSRSEHGPVRVGDVLAQVVNDLEDRQ